MRGALSKSIRYLPLNKGILGSSPTWGHDHESSYDTSNGWFEEADMRVIYLKYELVSQMSQNIKTSSN